MVRCRGPRAILASRQAPELRPPSLLLLCLQVEKIMIDKGENKEVRQCQHAVHLNLKLTRNDEWTLYKPEERVSGICGICEGWL